MVGYPNVGKSSTVNALVAKKKTGVSSTPGKTKHFQTLELGDGLPLADCPGLVFPSFTSSRAELVCNGVLPIDRLTDVRQPVAIVASRIPRRVFEATYKLKLPLPRCTRPEQTRDGGELLRAYSAARGLTVQHGRPDEQRAGRAILKDFINGKLLFASRRRGAEGAMGVAGGAIGEGEETPEDADEAHDAGEDDARAARGPVAPAAVRTRASAAARELEGLAPDDPLAKQLLEEMMNELGGLDGKARPGAR